MPNNNGKKMGSKSANYDEDLSNGESPSKGNDSSMIVNINDTHSDIENDESNYSQQSNNDENNDHEEDNSNDSNNNKEDSGDKKSSRKEDSIHRKKSPARDPKIRPSKVDVTKTRYLWVNGIPAGTKTSQLEELFNQHGKVLAIKIIRGSANTLLGFVKLETFEQAQRCMEKLSKTEFRGNKIEIFKERPVDKDEKKNEKIGFRETRKYNSKLPPPVKRPPFRSSRGSYRGSSKPLQPRIPPRIQQEMRRQEREEAFRLERERQKLKIERMKLERDKAELLKMERESRYERERVGHDDKRHIRSMVKRGPFDDHSFIHEDKRYDDYNRREEFPVRRYETRGPASPDRKINPRSFGSIPSRGRYEESSRADRYIDSKYDTPAKGWQMENSWINAGTSSADRWSSSGYDTPRMMGSTIGSNSLSRIHSADIPPGMSSRAYFSNRRY